MRPPTALPTPPFAVLRDDLERSNVPLSSSDWLGFTALCTEVSFRKGDVVFDIGAVPHALLFVTSGVAAAELLLPDGRSIIYRFFESSQMCTAITSAWNGTETADNITAMSALQGVSIPLAVWQDNYLYGEALGVYFRRKTVETLLFDKELIRVKTLNSTAASYSFLNAAHKRVVEVVAQKDIARFVGVTPEGLSRFLKSQRS